MPTPLELLADPISWASFALYLALLGSETIAPARALPRVRGWWLQGIAAFLTFFFVSAYFPLWLSPYLAPLALWDASELGTLGGGALALVLYQLLIYGYHRGVHSSDSLFRAFHQMHHSAERLDVSGAFWFSPLDRWQAPAALARRLRHRGPSAPRRALSLQMAV